MGEGESADTVSMHHTADGHLSAQCWRTSSRCYFGQRKKSDVWNL